MECDEAVVSVHTGSTEATYGYKFPEGEHDPVVAICMRCGETFRREYGNLDKPHACGVKVNGPGADLWNPVRMECKFLADGAKVPHRKRSTDAGLDITGVQTVTIPAHGSRSVQTGIALSVHKGWYYTIEGRSGLGAKGIMPFRGIIDSTYHGELIVILMNFTDEDYTVNSGDRIAQIILHRQHDADITIVRDFSPPYSDRGNAGFGSSGR